MPDATTDIIDETIGNDIIADPEQLMALRSDSAFSHEILVMLTYRKAIEVSAKEMRKGYWETKLDKFGNHIQTYNPDTRQELISTITTLYLVMSGDLDTDADTKIKNYLKMDKDMKTNLSDIEEAHYNSLPANERVKTIHIKGMLNQEALYYQYYLNSCVDIYRAIFQELELVLKRSRYFKKKLNIA